MLRALKSLYIRFRVFLRDLWTYQKAFGALRGAGIYFFGSSGKPRLEPVRIAGIAHPFYLRIPSSDLPTYRQVFLQHEYDFDCGKPPAVIVDAGANVGMASVYFANKYPNARIIALEPELSNFEMLKKNVAPYPNVVPVNAALWNVDSHIEVMDMGIGNWGFMTREAGQAGGVKAPSLNKVDAFSVPTLMARQGIEHIDIFKIDIEGAEKEVFGDTSAWIGRVGSIIIELHDSMKKGCVRAFYNGTNGFDDEWHQGENVYVTRAGVLVRKG